MSLEASICVNACRSDSLALDHEKHVRDWTHERAYHQTGQAETLSDSVSTLEESDMFSTNLPNTSEVFIVLLPRHYGDDSYRFACPVVLDGLTLVIQLLLFAHINQDTAHGLRCVSPQHAWLNASKDTRMISWHKCRMQAWHVWQHLLKARSNPATAQHSASSWGVSLCLNKRPPAGCPVGPA